MTSPLTYILLMPLLGAAAILLIPRNYRFVIRTIALVAAFIAMVLSIKLFIDYPSAPTGPGGFKFQELVPWVKSLGISYYVGVDGINLGIILMGAIVCFAAIAVSREIKKHEKEFYILMLLMTAGVLGAFASLDLFFFYFFHELALVPTFIMIGVWGRGEDRNYAAYKITIYLSLGALISLVGIIALYVQSGAETFSIVALTESLQSFPLSLKQQNIIFPLMLFGFGILVSLWPFHTWAPLGYGTAPTGAAMIHAGVLKKFGLYGILRIAIPLLPQAAASWVSILALLCLGNIVYCGFVAMRQRDLNFLIGNSSVAHVGFAFLGLASLTVIGITGAVMVMVAHGFLAALTFAISGYLHERTGTLDMDKMGGLLRSIPFIGAIMVMAAMAGCGLPGFANFAGEALVFFGAWKAFPVETGFALWGALVIGAIYMLRAVRTILHGPADQKWNGLTENMTLWRKFPYALLVSALLLFGFFPRLLTDHIKPNVEAIVNMARPAK